MNDNYRPGRRKDSRKRENAIFFPKSKNSKILARLIGMIFYEFDPTAITKYFIHVENSNQL